MTTFKALHKITLPLIALLAIIAMSGASVSSASAETTGPVWKIMSVSNPTNFAPGDETGADVVMVTATNVGGASTGCTATKLAAEELREQEETAKGNHDAGVKHGFCHPAYSNEAATAPASPVVSPVTISDSLPPGLTLAPVGTGRNGSTVPPIFGEDAYKNPFQHRSLEDGNPGPPFGLSCTVTPVLSCTDPEPVDPGDTLIFTIRVNVESAPPSTCPVPAEATSCVTNEATVSGGGAASASAGGAGGSPIVISSSPPPYGVAAGGLVAAASTNQAGGHPNVTTAFFLNTVNKYASAPGLGNEFYAESEPAGGIKDVRFDLSPGLVGTAVGIPRCTMAEVNNESNCPRDSMVGMATLIISNTAQYGRIMLTVPVFNIAPSPGEPAAFAFDAIFFSVRLDTSVLSDGDYGVRVTAPDITAGGGAYFSSVTIWGVPAEHNGPGPDAASRNVNGYQYLKNPGLNEGQPEYSFGSPGVEEPAQFEKIFKTEPEARVPFLSNPSQCSTSLEGVLSTDSWEGLGPGVFASEETSLGTDTGCDLLSFKPGVSMLPDTLEAGAPAGYGFNLSVPQNTEPEGLATPDVKKTTVTLPAGTVISPSAADGLGACTNEQFFGSGPREARPATPGSCPRDSQIGTVRIEAPALELPLTGDVYLASPECDPCTPADAQGGKMIRLFVQVVGEGESGIVVKLEGTGSINQQTGQITTTFENTPQLPFSDFQLTLQGGERASLANPRTCGEVATKVDLTPWSTPFTPDATPTSAFDIDENCFGAQFNPSFTAGTTSNEAGGFSPFTVSFGRSDPDEFLNGIQVKTPPGLLGMLSKVTLCGEAQANAGTCGPESQIGETSVETGPGADPFLVTGGKVYITGPYKGAPYGLSIVVPATAGPYTLSGTTGNGTVVNRSAINVNPETSALTVTSDPLPTELDGIPLQLRLVNVSINRPEFMFNPTSCNKLAVGATLTSTEAAAAGDASSFQVTNCAGLKFKPKFTPATAGKTSKAFGASLDTKVTYPTGAQGTEADIARVKVELPKQLPSRLTTLQKACTAAQFNANPAGCPKESVIGIAKVSTPVLRSQLIGPVYFVSNGGEAFPNLIVVLQGEGVRVDLVGDTFISKAGITSTTFKTLPDTPFNSFELYLPEGKYSALAANGNLCKSKLVMPNEFVAQNGAVIHESSKIAVTGCPKAKQAVKKKKKTKKKSRAKKASRDRRVGS